jgi:hypothetical protein
MIAINFRWPTPSTVLKNSDPTPYFSQPTPLLLYDRSLIAYNAIQYMQGKRHEYLAK